MDTSVYLDNSDETASLYRQRAELQAETAKAWLRVTDGCVYRSDDGTCGHMGGLTPECTVYCCPAAWGLLSGAMGRALETIDDQNKELAQTQAELSVARATIARYRRVTAIAATILDVASHTHVANLHLCPHGNSASYPTHGWWCDGCFLELEDALAAIRTEEAQG